MRQKTKKVEAAVAELLPPGFQVPEPVLLPLSMFQFAPYNPRKIEPEEMESLKASLLAFGMLVNLTVQLKSEMYGPRVLIGGHQRVTAMRELCRDNGWREPDRIPTVVLDVDDATAKMINIALNRISGDFDPYKLGQVLADIGPSLKPHDYVKIGFVEEDAKRFIRALQPPRIKPPEDKVGSFGASVTMSVSFTTVAMRDEAKVMIAALAQEREMLAGDLVLELLHAYKTLGKKRRS